MFRLAAPIVLAELGWMGMGVVDTIMVGRLPDSAVAIGATGIGHVLFFAIAIFGEGLLLGLDTVVSQSWGAGRVGDTHRALFAGIHLALTLSPFLMLAVLVTLPLMWAFGLNAAVLTTAGPYLDVMLWSLPFLLLYFVCRRYLQAIHIVAPITIALVSANLVNVFGNWVLIYGNLGAPAMGVVGSGWSTLFSRIYLALFLFAIIVWHERRAGAGLWDVSFRPSWERLRELLRLGIPAALHIELEVMAFYTVTALAAKLDAASLAAHQVALSVASLTFMVPLGISSAAAVRVGHELGAGDPAAAGRAGWIALGLGSVFMLVAAAAFTLFSDVIVLIFSGDAAVLQVGAILLTVAAFFQLFDGLQVISAGALRGSGDTRTPMFANLFGYWCFGIPFAAWLCFRMGWGVVGLWVGLSLGLVLIGSVLLLAWRRAVSRLV